MLLSNKSITVTSAPEIKNLCAPLAQQAHLNFFDYVRIYNSGTGFVLSNRPDVIDYLFTHEHKIIESVPRHLVKDKFYYILTPDSPLHERLLWEAKLLFNITYPLDIIERHKDYCELFCFSNTSGSSDVINSYLNNMGKIKHFIKDFKKNAAPLICKADNNLINLPQHMLPNFRGTDVEIADETPSCINKQNTPARSMLKNSNSVLTPREIDCLRTLATTYTIKKCAKQLNLSPRTVEFYLNNIKSKLGLTNKSKLLDFINDNHKIFG